MVNGPRDPFGRPQWSDRPYAADHPPPVDVGIPRHPELQEFNPQQADRPMEILRALNEHCKIPASQVFLAIVDHHGHTKTYSSPNLKEDVSKFFHEQRWAEYAANQAGRAPPAAGRELGFDEYQRQMSNSRGLVTRRRTRSIATDNGAHPPRKMRGSASRRGGSDEDAPGKVSVTKRPIEIGNEAAIWDFYDQRFKNIQQTACKQIAKAWVRLIAPKKQSVHPYTGKEEKQPDWWPKPWGPTKDDRVRHKEPDHLYRHERVHLLCAIVRMIVKPAHEQHPDFHKLNLSVAKLEEAAFDSLNGWFADKEHPNNVKKRPFLKEIFLVARHEEKYLKGECDATTNVYVVSDDKIPATGAESDAEDGEHEEEDAERRVPRSAISSASLSPTRNALVPALGHDQPGLPAAYLSEVQHRTVSYQPQPILTSGIHGDAHGHGYIENSTMGVAGSAATLHPHSAGISPAQDIYAHSQSSSRRPSMYNSPTDFASGTSTGMYQTWQQTTTGSNPAPSLYAITPQQVPSSQAHIPMHPHPQAHPHQAQAQGQTSFVSQSGVAVPQPPTFMSVGSNFDDMSRERYGYESQHDLYRAVPSNPAQPQGFTMPLPHDGRDLRDIPLPSNTIKPDHRGFQH